MYYHSRQSICLTTQALVVHYFVEPKTGEKTIIPLTYAGKEVALTSREWEEIESVEPKLYEETNLTPSDVLPICTCERKLI